ncbi:unknown [Firmicutes bacterium CAG:791]|nr:unknown [Firmicutes bacterium CAG:791]
MHRHGIFHLCRQNLLDRDTSPRDFSSLQTEPSRQGCIATGFFIPADRIFSAGMHRPGIFHPYRQNLLGRDASPRHFSSLQTKFPRQGCIVSAIMPQASGRPRSPPSSPQFTSTLAGRTLIKPAVPIFKLPAFIPDDLFPVSRGTFRIQFRMTNSVSA